MITNIPAHLERIRQREHIAHLFKNGLRIFRAYRPDGTVVELRAIGPLDMATIRYASGAERVVPLESLHPQMPASPPARKPARQPARQPAHKSAGKGKGRVARRPVKRGR